MQSNRRAGILLHPTSLPGPHGIGSLGEEAFSTLDWVAEAGFRVLQVLPLNPTGYGDSPYQCFSAFAGNPYMISLSQFLELGWISENDVSYLNQLPADRVNFGEVTSAKQRLLDQVYYQWLEHAKEHDRERFVTFREKQSHWLDDFALFMAIKEYNDMRCWNEWPVELRDRHPEALDNAREELKDRIERHTWRQYIFFCQWSRVKKHANELGVKIMGDMPIFVAYDSADSWANRDLFHFAEDGNPTKVAGVPPDYFSETGQRWGNPLYKWERHLEQDFAWWKQRIGTALESVDLVRIDHFRGFSACWEIPASEPTAVNGEWVDAPGRELFESVERDLGHLPLIAEDLGIITDDVTALRKQFSLPGMCVLQFAWTQEDDNPFLPKNHEQDSVVYTGTHDNNTTLGWWKEEAGESGRRQLEEYIGHPVENPVQELMQIALDSIADLAVVPMQDLLELDSNAKMNRPGEAAGNWSWRVQSHQLHMDLAEQVFEKIQNSNRLNA